MDKRVRPKIEKGSITVFFAMLLPVLTLFFAALLSAVDMSLAKVLGTRFVQSASLSVLGEFDRGLEEKFGIYALRYENNAADAFSFYLKENAEGDIPFLLAAYEIEEVDLIAQETLASLTVLREQINDFMEYRTLISYAKVFGEYLDSLKDLGGDIADIISIEPGNVKTDGILADILTVTSFDVSRYAVNRSLLLEKKINLSQLPSNCYEIDDDEEDISWEDLSGLVWKLLQEAGETIATKANLVEYATGMFSNFEETVSSEKGNEEKALSLRGTKKAPGFFKNEVEYLLKGTGNELANVKAVKRRMIALRVFFNMAAFLSNPEKMEKLAKITEKLGGGQEPAIAVAVAGTTLVAWCIAEAELDYTHLIQGDPVPLLKASNQWEIGSDSYQEPENGLDYQEHLKFLLALVPEEKLLARIADLIYLEEGGKIDLDDYVTTFTATGYFRKSWKRYSFSLTKGY